MSTALVDTDGGNGLLARHELDEVNPPPADAWGIVDAPFPPQPRTNPPTSLGQAKRSAGVQVYGGINLNNSSTSPRAAADLVFRL